LGCRRSFGGRPAATADAKLRAGRKTSLGHGKNPNGPRGLLKRNSGRNSAPDCPLLDDFRHGHSSGLGAYSCQRLSVRHHQNRPVLRAPNLLARRGTRPGDPQVRSFAMAPPPTRPRHGTLWRKAAGKRFRRGAAFIQWAANTPGALPSARRWDRDAWRCGYSPRRTGLEGGKAGYFDRGVEGFWLPPFRKPYVRFSRIRGFSGGRGFLMGVFLSCPRGLLVRR